MPIDYLDPAIIGQVKHKELPHHTLGLSYTATGYGGKIPSVWMLRLLHKKVSPEGDITIRWVWHRVYHMCYGNSSSAYVIKDGQDFFLEGTAEHYIERELDRMEQRAIGDAVLAKAARLGY